MGRSPGVNDGSEKNVYFNSVEYNGYQFLTEDASLAGYSLDGVKVKPDASVLRNGIASIIEHDIESMLYEAESALLRLLVRSRKSRLAARNMLTTNRLCSVELHEKSILWSSNAKRWLFECLVGINSEVVLEDLPDDVCKLRVLLATLPNIPSGSFSKVMSQKRNDGVLATDKIDRPNSRKKTDEIEMIGDEVVTMTIQGTDDIDSVLGELDSFFYDDTINYNSDASLSASMDPYQESRADLRVQELYTYLLSASKDVHLKRLRIDILAHSLPPARSEDNASNVNDQENSLNYRFDFNETVSEWEKTQIEKNERSTRTEGTVDVRDRSREQLLDEQYSQLNSVTTDRIREFNEVSLKGIVHAHSIQKTMNKLFDQSVNDGRPEGRLSSKVQSDLNAMLDAYVGENDFRSADVLAAEMNEYFSTNDEPYEDALERYQEEWGDWYDDDYIWSPSDINTAQKSGQDYSIIPSYHYNDGDRETVEDAFKRMEREWGE